MSEVSTSRRAVMRALAILPAVIVAPQTAQAAAQLVCAPQSPVNDERWRALLAEMARADAAHSEAFEAWGAAETRYYELKPEMWKAVLRPTSTDENGVIFFDPDVYNAEVAASRKKHQEDEAEARRVSGYDEAEAFQSAALDRLTASIKAIIAYPSREPDIIAAKLQLIIREYGDDNGDLAPLLSSITGEA